MPKKKDLVKRVHQLAKSHGATAKLIRQSSHEIWECAGFRFPIPRHREIAEGTARMIIKRLAQHLESLEHNDQEHK